ncbi:phage tail assembly chaperone G [Pluralibacter gergoviae]|uniref:phage tail assembly chaperone G n=1 Tax=Pluralibacter gergoviae TaxID=61647 RepID=UPI000A3D0FE8|nr:phage minor tail protein G [Pluralibacter gergoviae]EKT9643077.1 phage minor tail protein G [Pluralibacter gergoviae]EKV3545333.1 phage minor tail protein G [Pluralibacter gergoviae]EKV9898259.1 phage minor tail protein G [Pluralibacter gergoviae]EKV9933099.1 phage minor tail protein G [Pluralibacter gergoviae]EMD1658821.1 phage minor tail protein G [Pluralibacter gergoviae]
MDFLKKEEFEHNGVRTQISELSALQRISYLEYLAREEKDLSVDVDELSEQEVNARLINMDISTGALLIALSLWHNDPSGPSEEELQQQVLRSWPPEAIGKAQIQIQLLSGMLPPVSDEEQETESIDNTLPVDEPVTAEKP